ncbi:MAG TPA: acetyl-CoA carboxylase biotin carboxyl carrier protein [Bryobacteraceae bacterium]|nr:acetyl-CoA carboxylase biotin carboxyl carrier protein [Bryobacteraceae bacterium]
MSNDEIRELIQMVLDSGVAEIEVQRGDNRVRIRRAVAQAEVLVPQAITPVVVASAPPPQAVAAAAAEHATIAAPAPAPPHTTSGAGAGGPSDSIIVKSPIVGTFYDAPSPGAPPFVKVGDQVEPGQVLCIIESMKLMNEIEAEVAGVIVSKLMESGRPVEYGEALFAVRPR